MNWFKEFTEEFSDDKAFQFNLQSFYKNYGISGLKQAMQLYTDTRQEYICKTKTSISKLKIYVNI